MEELTSVSAHARASTRLAGAGAAVGRDAPFRAISEAISELGGREPAVVLFFPSVSLDPQEIVEQARDAAAGAVVAGMTSAGEVTADGMINGGCSAIALDTSIAVGVGVGKSASVDPRGAGYAAASAAIAQLDHTSGHALLLVFVDPQSGDQSHIVRGVYDVVGGRVPLAGGGANGRTAALFASGRAYRDAVVAVSLVSPERIGIGVAHGCVSRAVPGIVTRSADRIILGIDGRPAEEVYLEKIGRGGVRLRDEEFEALAVLHPLAQPEVTGNVRLRHILGRAPSGGLACATHIPATAAVGFAEQTPATIIESARRAARDAVGSLSGPPRAALVFDCAARKRALGGAVASEVAALVSSLDNHIPVAGLYTRGEIGRTRGAKGDLNHSVVVAAFE